MGRVKTGSGWYDLAGAMLGISGIFHGFAGLMGLFKEDYFAAGSTAFLELQHWAWAWLALGILQIVAAGMLLGGGGRTLGIVVTALSAVVVFMSHGIFPHDGTLVILVDLLILYGLTVHKPVGAEGLAFPMPAHEMDRPTPPPMH